MCSIEKKIDEAASCIAEADALLITAGAGIGVDSGLPDFRGNEGFWKAYPPIGKRGISFSDMANPSWFRADPELAWAFYGHRLNLYRRTIPHSGFSQLLKIARQKKGNYFVFTSNVDGQFQKAGYSKESIIECHGSIHHFQCTDPCGDAIWDACLTDVVVDEEAFKAQSPLPKCIHCSSLARPNILMFSDWNWLSHRMDSQSDKLSSWLNAVSTKKMKLVVVEAGAGKAVPTVRMQSESIAQVHDGTLIRINPRDYLVPAGHISIPMGSAEGIGRICEII